MASADYSVGTKVTADVSNFERGMNKAEKSLKGFSDKLANSIDRLGKKGLIGSVANVTLAMQGLTKSFNTVIKFAKDVGNAINECTESYKGQIIAERALDTAIANNPFISGESSKALKRFASDMQRVTNYGDEELIPMMTNLVSLGRTESEVMQIMSVAMDMSAGMGISLDSAITQLNATLNGSIGRLGQQNAELKGLTEEELKQGKAIEILGEKFKGLSGATADTSKQLKNIKGDFKEALGQFTLPSSDMWNKFWAGFYERGIEVLRKLDDYLDINTVGKKIFENIQDEAKKIAKSKKLKIGDVLEDFNFISEQLSGLSEKELSVLKKSLEGIKDRTDIEQYWLNMVSKRLHNIELEADQERANAKAEAEKAKAEEARLAREKELAELRKKQAEERAKQLKVENQWQDKILDQQISMLENEKESAVAGAEERGEATYQIEREYNEKLLELRLQKVEKEREAELKAENVTADAKIAINQYYDNEVKKIYDELGKYKRKKNEEEKKDEKSKFKIILEYLAQYAKKVADTISNIAKKVASVAKDVISKVGSIFKGALNVFKFNPDDALNSLLAIEDAILTFFVETLPKLPSFFSSAIQSIIILIRTLLNAIDWDKVQEIINSVIDIIVENAPQIVNDLVDLVIHIAQTLLNAIIHFVESGGWKTLLDLLLDIQKKIENFFIENIDDIVNTIADMIPDLIEFLKNSIVSASKTLGKLAPKILPLIADLINAIIDVITSDEVVNASIEAIEGIIEGLVPAIVKLLTNALPKIINFFLLKLPSYTPKLVSGIIKGLIKGFLNVDWGQVVKDIFTGFIDAVKDLFGIHSPSTLFESFGGFMIEGLINGITGMIDSLGTIFAGLAQGITNIFNDITSNITNIFNNLTSNTAGGLNNFANNVTSVFNNLSDNTTSVFNNLTSNITGAFNNLTNNLTSVFNKISDVATSIFNNMTSSITSIFNGLTSSVTSIINGLGSSITSVFNNAISNITSLLNNLLSQATNLINTISNISLPGISLGGSSGGSSGGSDKVSTGSDLGDFAVDVLVPGGRDVVTRVKDAVDEVSDWVDSWKWWATGSNAVPSGVAVVGEAGPELVKFRGGEQVLNTRNTNKALANMGGNTNNFNVTFNNLQDTSAFTMIQQLKQYNRQMAINGVI